MIKCAAFFVLIAFQSLFVCFDFFYIFPALKNKTKGLKVFSLRNNHYFVSDFHSTMFTEPRIEGAICLDFEEAIAVDEVMEDGLEDIVDDDIDYSPDSPAVDADNDDTNEVSDDNGAVCSCVECEWCEEQQGIEERKMQTLVLPFLTQEQIKAITLSLPPVQEVVVVKQEKVGDDEDMMVTQDSITTYTIVEHTTEDKARAAYAQYKVTHTPFSPSDVLKTGCCRASWNLIARIMQQGV